MRLVGVTFLVFAFCTIYGGCCAVLGASYGYKAGIDYATKKLEKPRPCE